jgi:hypothetical protein
MKLQPKTLKLDGIIKNRNVTIVVYSYSTHNCIDINLAKQLNLFVYSIEDPTITIVDGQKVKGVGICHKISVKYQNLNYKEDSVHLSLNEMDMVLASKWLI